ncbi:hypothetical protein RHSIM_Rhsim02G0133500 [Rhododendron simsii]|uniref:Uncharacterized protein n=1 Tax=Rhododendron simsii TaxID=118357 RepID=A0A834LX17_RHOSS|nr:hypothetical protein RHSIM_Rhsim02G0133500 [Rhododendron simsii]
MVEPLSQEMTSNKRERESADGASSSVAAADSSPDPMKVCFVISHLEKPIAHEIYLIDVRDISCNSGSTSSSSTSEVDNDWTQQEIQNVTPAIELPSGKYPESMAFFNVGPRVYMVGGERVTAPPHTRSEKNTHLERCVYVCDTASPPPLSVVPACRMNGGKRFPFVSHVNGKFYVLSAHPTRSTRFTNKTPLFESFEPDAGMWSVLPNPPFYDYGEYPYRGSPGLVESNTVVRSKIFFYTTHKDFLYAFDTDRSEWETFNMSTYNWENFPFRSGAPILIPDYGMWSTVGYPLTAHALIPEKGFVSKGVEGLTALLNHHPSLSYSVHLNVLDSKNGWFCLLKSGCHAHSYAGGKPSLLASVFRLVENRKDKVAAFEVYRFPSHDKFPALEKGARPPDYERIVGETSVLAAADLRCSLFKVESKYFEEESGFTTSFLL